MKAVKSARRRYSDEFKVQAVKLARDPHMQTKDVAAALAIHPFMLTRWNKEYREGLLRDRRGNIVELAKRKVREHLRVVHVERELEAQRSTAGGRVQGSSFTLTEGWNMRHIATKRCLRRMASRRA